MYPRVWRARTPCRAWQSVGQPERRCVAPRARSCSEGCSRGVGARGGGGGAGGAHHRRGEREISRARAHARAARRGRGGARRRAWPRRAVGVVEAALKHAADGRAATALADERRKKETAESDYSVCRRSSRPLASYKAAPPRPRPARGCCARARRRWLLRRWQWLRRWRRRSPRRSRRSHRSASITPRSTMGSPIRATPSAAAAAARRPPSLAGSSPPPVGAAAPSASASRGAAASRHRRRATSSATSV